MQHERDAVAGTSAVGRDRDVALDHREARRALRTDEVADFVEVASLPGREVVEADHHLV